MTRAARSRPTEAAPQLLITRPFGYGREGKRKETDVFGAEEAGVREQHQHQPGQGERKGNELVCFGLEEAGAREQHPRRPGQGEGTVQGAGVFRRRKARQQVY